MHWRVETCACVAPVSACASANWHPAASLQVRDILAASAGVPRPPSKHTRPAASSLTVAKRPRPAVGPSQSMASLAATGSLSSGAFAGPGRAAGTGAQAGGGLGEVVASAARYALPGMPARPSLHSSLLRNLKSERDIVGVDVVLGAGEGRLGGWTLGVLVRLPLICFT